MELSKLSKLTTKAKRRVGRGYGSGRAKTAGRGSKGQKARGKVRAGFEGGQLPIILRLPLYRGKLRNRPYSKKPLGINVKVLNVLPKNTVVNDEVLVKYHIVREEVIANFGVKILGDGRISVPLTVALPVSKKARTKIEAAGGSVVENKPKQTVKK
ncbi:50S ribosomal protein L15 [Candidatus Microgenomates bacterium]|nr:MAG: 50S ribosomal protein L15 [Candidatus Microgenomates bacterium]